MRDIRQDLTERMRLVEKELDAALAKVQSLERTKETLKDLLRAENDQWTGVSDQRSLGLTEKTTNGRAHKKATPLSNIIRDYLADGKEHHLDDIVQAAVKREYPFGTKSPGRAVHFALVGLAQNKLVEQHEDSYWQMKLDSGRSEPPEHKRSGESGVQA